MTSVIKFGGAAMSQAETIAQCLDITVSHKNYQIIVVSALYGLTDQLILGAQEACSTGSTHLAHTVAHDMKSRYLDIFENLKFSVPQEFKEHLEETTQNYLDICNGLKVLKEFTQKCYDHIAAHGERTSALLLQQLLVLKKHPSVYLDASDFIRVQVSSMGITPLEAECEHLIRQQFDSHLKNDTKIIIPGFIAWDPEDLSLVTLGKGGADYTAFIVAQATHSESVILFKDTDGLMTADRQKVPNASPISHLHYKEASEFAYCSSGILHPRTMRPLIRSHIPLIIKNFRYPNQPGTLIDNHPHISSSPVQAITTVDNQTMIHIEGYGLTGTPGIAGKVFQTLSEAKIFMTLISQASSENSICITTHSKTSQRAIKALKKAFACEVQQGLIHKISSVENLAIVSIVGLGMHGKIGLASQCLQTIAKAGINIHGLAQGASELNISIVISELDAQEATQALHQEFQLSSKDRDTPINTLHASNNTCGIHIHGFGHVGQAFARRALASNLPSHIASVSDSKGTANIDNSQMTDDVENMIHKKQHGESFITPSSHNPYSLFIDCTASQTFPTLMQNIREKKHIITANKLPLSGTQDQWETLHEMAASRGLYLGYEATVGSGLPIIRTIRSLLSSHDDILSIYGSFSGSLGAIFSQMTLGCDFSEAVRHAYESGFTEPDLREDLTAQDVQRKCLILARILGMKIEAEDVHLEPVCSVPNTDNQARILFELEEQNKEFKERVQSCEKRGLVLRYTASISASQGVHIGMEEVEKNSPCGLLQGSSNLFIIETKFQSLPLLLSGPGAGIQETASGLLSDLHAFFEGKTL
ncbi:MAG: aspartate kinase [Oligoflexales bacterium]